MLHTLPEKDSRLRKDRRALEAGDIHKAAIGIFFII